uniref:Uncharacterized protein n=1 Tax=Heligmosomoides polygyrus TaxID=6339 RepID=A0A183GAL5_HELPZ
LNWTASGGGLMMLFCALSSFHHKNILHLLPVFPTVSYLGYHAHYCYGHKLTTIDEVASKILHDDIELVAPSTVSVQDVRSRMKELKELKQEEDLFL